MGTCVYLAESAESGCVNYYLLNYIIILFKQEDIVIVAQNLYKRARTVEEVSRSKRA